MVAFTTSCADEDVARASQLHANCYIVKPLFLEQFLQAIRTIEDFWLGTAELPPQSA